MSRIFLSHSSTNNAEAVALRDWLRRDGWDDVFLDIDPDRGIAAGQRWERALNEAAHRCEAVLFLVSRAWLASGWCLREFNLAHRLNKRLFGLLIEDIPMSDLPVNLTGTWQLIRFYSRQDHVMLRVTIPISGQEACHVSADALARLRTLACSAQDSTLDFLLGRLSDLKARHIGVELWKLMTLAFLRPRCRWWGTDRLRGLRDAAHRVFVT